jgi:type II secretory pathway pseudopilin PulG
MRNFFTKKVISYKRSEDDLAKSCLARAEGDLQVTRKSKSHSLATCHLPLSTDSGFTIVETLVAITILMIAIAGPLTIAEKALSAAIYARDHLMASYLAQDAMESIKNIVDTNEITIHGGNNSQSIDWLDASNDGFTELSYCSSTSGCEIDTINNSINQPTCPSTNASFCPPLNLSSSGYVQDTTKPVTPFTRYFYVKSFTLAGGGNAANVVVTVTWPGDVTGGGGVTLEDTMYDTPLQ